MFSFELSVFDFVLSVGVIALVVIFAATLLKLNPSGESKESKNVNVYEEDELTISTQGLNQLNKACVSQNVLQGAEKVASGKLQQSPQLTVTATAGGSSQESLEQTPKTFGYVEPPKNHKHPEVPKQAPKSSEEKDCLHFFGYLGGLPKNTSIPGECFGCQRIVDCLITPKRKP